MRECSDSEATTLDVFWLAVLVVGSMASLVYDLSPIWVSLLREVILVKLRVLLTFLAIGSLGALILCLTGCQPPDTWPGPTVWCNARGVQGCLCMSCTCTKKNRCRGLFKHKGLNL